MLLIVLRNMTAYEIAILCMIIFAVYDLVRLPKIIIRVNKTLTEKIGNYIVVRLRNGILLATSFSLIVILYFLLNNHGMFNFFDIFYDMFPFALILSLLLPTYIITS